MLRDRLAHALRAAILFGLLALAWWTLRGIGHAQDRAPRVPAPAHLSTTERVYALLLARVSYNEAGDSEADLALVHQAARAHGPSAERWIGWLSRHSPCVSGRLPLERALERPGRCRWTRHLRPDGRLPRQWPGTQTAWHRERPRWLAHLERATRFRTLPIVCPVAPQSWDGARWVADVLARGWRVLQCKGEPRNLGVVR